MKKFPAVMTSVCSSSMQMLSVPGDFPVFICFIAWVTTCSVLGLQWLYPGLH